MVIKNAMVATYDGTQKLDVRVNEGKIAEVAPSLEEKSVIDANGKYLLPAIVDVGVGVMDGKLRGGTLKRLSGAAHKNGFGSVILSSFCSPRIEDEITLEFAKSHAELCKKTQILTLASGVKESGGLSDCSILLKKGAVGIEFESHIDGNLIRRLMEYASMHGVKLFCRANDPALQGDGVMHEGEVSCRLGLSGISAVAESSQIARIGELAEYYNVDVVVLGASTPKTLEICAMCSKLYPQISLHHLFLNDTVCDNYNTAGKIWPPLRDETMRKEMLKSVLKEEAAMITSLHTPVCKASKDAVFADAAYGIEGFENFLPLLYTLLVRKENFDFSSLIRMISTNPAAAVGLEGKKGAVEPGYDADLLLFDPNFSFVCEDQASPYNEFKIFGRVEPVYEDLVCS